MSNLLHILDMPILENISSSECRSFATTRSIEEDTIEDFRFPSKILSRIEGHTDIHTSHTIEILEKLGDAFTSGLIRDDEALGIVFRERCRLAPWA